MTSPTPPAGPPSGGPSEPNTPAPAPSGPEPGAAPPAGGPTPPSPQNDPQGGAPSGEPDQRPPWEREGVDFDPEKAWRLVQNTRAERDSLKAERDQHKTRLDEIDRGNMSAQQQAETDRDSFKTRAEAAEWELARHEVAAEKGLAPAALEFLTGSTRDELAASADRLLAWNPAAGTAPAPSGPPSHRPTERLTAPPSGGSDPTAQPIELDPDKLAAAIPRRP